MYSSSRKSILALTLSKKILSSRSKYKPSNVVVINPPFVFLIIKSCSNSFASIWVSAFSIIAFDVIDEKDEKSNLEKTVEVESDVKTKDDKKEESKKDKKDDEKE